MLSKFELTKPFRSLDGKTFSSDARFGKRTVIYGHNGSGKSSLAELLYQIGEGAHTEAIDWFDDAGKRLRIPPREKNPSGHLSVFTKSWIKKNVEAFLDGDTAEAIITLGSDQLGAKEDERRLNEDLEAVEEKLSTATEILEARRGACRAVVTGVQENIEGALGSFDRTKYTKQQYKAPKVQRLLQNRFPSVIENKQYQENLSDLKRGPLPSLGYQPPEHPDWDKLSERIRSLCERSVDGQLIESLLGDPSLQAWLQQGLSLHAEEDDCHFCTNPISAERNQELRSHFDRSRKEVQDEAEELQRRIQTIRSAYEAWQSKLPTSEDVYSELHGDLESSLADEKVLLNDIYRYLKILSEVLCEKYDAPERVSFQTLPAPPANPGEKIGAVAKKHEKILTETEERQTRKADEVATYMLSSRAEEYRSLKSQEDAAVEEEEELQQESKRLKGLIQEARAKQTTSEKMATQITSDLALVYGKSHLSIRVSGDSKGYICYREGKPARNLSDGERNTLALVYFLRQLQDQRETVKEQQRLVVVDDPSSSLDRESLYATHSWLLESLGEYGQTIILTHDFEMLRLLLNSQQRQVTNSRRALKVHSNDSASSTRAAKERQYPKISFLEMRASQLEDGNRRSSLRQLSEKFIDHRTEYHYLFDRILTGIENPEDHGLLFLLPNAARRVLESFSSFQVPNEKDFGPQLRKLAIEDSENEYRDVYHFCNRFSHGEGRETQLLMDANEIERNIRRSMELLRAVDGKHYERMLQATGRTTDPLEAAPR